MDPFQNRRWVIILIMLGVGLIFMFRLLFIQVINKDWADRAAQISSTIKNIQPPRGFIYDRNQRLLVGAEQAYDIMILPKAIKKSDSLIICELFNLSIEELRVKIKEASSGYNVSYKASVFYEALTKSEYAKIAPTIGQISGLYGSIKTQRGYPLPIAAHVLGYIRKISKRQYEKSRKNNLTNYSKNDYLGITGLEKKYELELRGKRGNENFLKDYAGNKVETIEKDPAKPGCDLHTTLDADLQLLGEELMRNKLGCVVAIEPSSGEILSMVSAPSFDPSLFSGRDFPEQYQKLLLNDTLKPLLNRPIYNDKYRPGSIFKLVHALIALQEGVLSPSTGFTCDKTIIGCHSHEPPVDLITAIKHSCNPYFYQVYKRIILRGKSDNYFEDSRLGLANWELKAKKFGFGEILGIDIPEEKKGFLPNVDFYDEWYGKKRWAFSTIYSNSIGEGEIGVSPLQMANLAAIIANRGYYYTPHLVKHIGEEIINPKFIKKHTTKIDSNYFIPVIDAMEQVVLNGTASRAQLDSVSVCGKTGTVENKSFNDHSVFIAFAPKVNPKIAIAVYVEYGTWGGTWAAPIASVMIDKYINRTLSNKSIKNKHKITEAVILNKNSDFTF
jgi:penicillin-binding protein 2